MTTASNPRNRNQLALSAANSQPAQLPSIPAVTSGTPAEIIRFCAAVKEVLEVRFGGRANPFEKALTMRDFKSVGLSAQTFNWSLPEDGVGVPVRAPDGSLVTLSLDQFALGITRTLAYRNLMKGVSDQTRFDDMPAKIRDMLLVDIADEAAKRGADVRRIEEALTSATESLAYSIREVTAAFEGNAAGVRETIFAYANENRAQAGIVTQIRARLNDFGGSGATVEQVLRATADRTAGLAAEYFVKLAAGKAVAGISLAATEDPEGNTDSAFIVLANRFAVVMPQTSIPDPNNPPAAYIPFGVDANGAYVNGQLRVNASGATLQSVTRRLVLTTSSTYFKGDANGTSYSPAAITFSTELSGGLTGTPSLAVISGSATLSGNTLYPGNMGTDTVTVRATVVMDGQAYRSDVTITRVRDGAAGQPGQPGQSITGPAGDRGSVTRYLSGSGFNDAAARASLPSLPNGQPVIGDTVTFSSSTTAITKYWSGYGWVDPGVVIDGNLIVSKTISAAAIAAGNMLGVNLVGSNRVQVLGNTPGSGGWDCSTATGPLKVIQYCNLEVRNESDSQEVLVVDQNAKTVTYRGGEVVRKGPVYNILINGTTPGTVQFT